MKKFGIVIVLVISIVFSSSIIFANGLPFEKYKEGLISFENQDWSEAEQYFDEIILEDLSYSEYLAKSLYLKTILLAAKIDRDVELQKVFTSGEKAVSFKEGELKNDLKNKANDYKLSAKRQVDTLIGLANYLLTNLPPLNLDIDFINNRWDYDPEWIDTIKEGNMISEERLNVLENGILAERVKDYLDLTLGASSFNNIFVITAERGDNLYYLSKEYNVPLDLLLDLNKHIEDPNLIYPNEKIYIPKRSTLAINYPAYFYYISNISYQANKERKEDITRLVFRAYQLTSDKSHIPYPKDYEIFMEGIEVQDYQQKVTAQAKEIRTQDQKINEMEAKYNELMKELQQLKSSLDKENNKRNSNNDFLEDSDYEEYNPSEDPLTY
ncbi:LysM domain-containing protein [Orenia metallireducens]|uniref:LysM domain-containing protein n=1 Tax=Orenia metallireducens TaxID=1413210 RepID=A0A285GWL1_9FIRM|nr:LysM domain-containing protein [Orenia metallireducens]PRX31056.1 LysM domain-containing protein [Orenia metallireducens]SNY27865.1 LysM domain-containing protein [Orenia metallireducens]